MKSKNNLQNWQKNIWNFIGIVLGVSCIIVGMVVLEGRNLVYYKALSFGADFYTEIHTAAANLVTATRNVSHQICTAMGAFFILFGGIDICFFGSKITMTKNAADGGVVLLKDVPQPTEPIQLLEEPEEDAQSAEETKDET